MTPNPSPVPAPPSVPFPLTDLQEGYLVGSSDLIELGGFAPTMYVELDLVALDPARAEAAVQQLVARHEHLRTVVLADGTQRVLSEEEVRPFRLPVTDLVGQQHQHQQAALARTRERMCGQGVAPTGWPLFEIVVHRLRRHRHRVHFAMSLLLLDSQSTRQLQDEWWQLYQDPDTLLPPVPGTFRECVAARLAQQDTATFRRQWSYWQERLDSLPDAPQLPLARPPATISPVRLARRTCYLTTDQWRQLCANARTHRMLPNAAMLHVFAETLGAWAQSPRFCLNVLHQNWTTSHPTASGVVGQFSATLPLEVDLRGGDGFWERGRELQRQLWRDMSHSDVTAVQVTRELAARRGWTSRAALPYVFNSMLGPARPAPAGRPACRTVASNLRTPQVLVDNQLQDAPDGGVACVWDVVEGAFPDQVAEAMFEAYQHTLTLLASPQGAEAEPDPLPPGYRELIAADNPDPAAGPVGRLEDGFLRQAVARPGDPAVLSSGRTLTYRELAAASASLARSLQQRGVGAGHIVPVVMTKGWEQVVAVLATLRAGAAYCPVDSGLPPERIRYLCQECAAPVVLTQSHHVAGLASAGQAPLPVDRLVQDALANPAATPLPGSESPGDPDGNDLGYVIYTSGSTGTPKGVMVAHSAALNTIQEINERIALAPADRVFGISSLSFDLSVWDVFGTLAAGAALVLPAAAGRVDPAGWVDTAVQHRVTVWNSVPALAEMLVEAAEQRPPDRQPPIRVFLLSGDWIPTSLPDRLRTQWPAAGLTALGGATEAAIWSNCYQIDEVDPTWDSIPYGRPLRNQTMRVLDHQLRVRPPWAVGEIYIGGAGLALGYTDPAHTARRFVHHPGTGERLYRTGDLGRYWPDGTIELLGRADRQLKIQGFRVEPGEVEAAIRTHPAVHDCVVGAQDGPGGQRRLAAVVVARDGAAIDPAAVTAYLRERLPHYLVPALLGTASRLPLSANGKVDAAAALAAVTEPTPDGAAGGRSMDGVLTKQLGALWAELLEVPSVTPDSDFFALGGNSLLALRLVNRVRSDLGVQLQLGQVFEAPTLGGLAGRITDHGPRARCAVPLANGDGPRLFLFHPVGGSVSSYADLAEAWPGAVRGFQSRALLDPDPTGLAPDLEAMAAGYCEELTGLSPDGPYLLGGWSMGGVLAYEVAGQLAAQGRLCHVFMVDSDIRSRRVPAAEVDRHLEFLADLAGGRLPAGAASAVRDAGSGAVAEAARKAAVAHGLLPAELSPAEYRRLQGIHAHHLKLLAAYRPPASTLPTLLLVAGDVRRPDPVPAWREVCPAIEVEVWPEDHYSIIGNGRAADIAARVEAWWRSDRRPVPTG